MKLNLEGVSVIKPGEDLPEGYVKLGDILESITEQQFKELLDLYDTQYTQLSAEYGKWKFHQNVHGWLELCAMAGATVSMESKRSAVNGYIMMLDYYKGQMSEMGDLDLE